MVMHVMMFCRAGEQIIIPVRSFRILFFIAAIAFPFLNKD